METTQNTNQGVAQIAVALGALTIDNVKPGLPNNKNEVTKHRAQLRQEITKTYPSGKAHDSLTDPLFSLEEFGFSEGNKYNEVRVGWIDVPIGTTVEQVAARLAGFPQARLVRHLSLAPILSDEQARGIQAGIVTLEDIASKQVVRDKDENPVPFKGYLQYRVIKLALEAREDIDTRDAEYAKMVAEGVNKPFQMASPVSVIAKAAGQAVTANAQK